MNDRKFNPALFARLAAGNGFALIQRYRALRREACSACAQPIAMPVTSREYLMIYHRYIELNPLVRFLSSRELGLYAFLKSPPASASTAITQPEGKGGRAPRSPALSSWLSQARYSSEHIKRNIARRLFGSTHNNRQIGDFLGIIFCGPCSSACWPPATWPIRPGAPRCARARVPDEYQAWKRALDLYVLTRIPFAAGVRDWQVVYRTDVFPGIG